MKKFFATTFSCLLAALICLSVAAYAARPATSARADVEGIQLHDESYYEVTLSGVTGDIKEYAVAGYGEDTECAVYDGSDIYVYGRASSVARGDGNAFPEGLSPRGSEVYTGGTVRKISWPYGARAMGYSDGTLCWTDMSGNTYILGTDGAETYEGGDISLPAAAERIDTDGYTYYINGSGNLCVADFSSDTLTVNGDSDGYTLLKESDGGYYVADGSCLYRLDGGVMTEIVLKYYDYTINEPIATFGIADVINGADGVYYAVISDDALMIEVDDASFAYDYFDVLDVCHAYEAGISSNPEGYVHVLALSGNAALVVYNGRTYLTLYGNISDIRPAGMRAADISEGYAVDGTYVYYVPYACSATRICPVGTDTRMEIISVVSGSAYAADFYEVRIETDGGEITGYVLKDFVTEYAFGDDGAASVTEGGDTSYDNVVITAVLVGVVVLIIVVALIYVSVVLTGRRRGRGSRSGDGTDSGTGIPDVS